MQVMKYSMNGEQGPWLPMEPYGGDYALPFEHRDKRADRFSFRLFDVHPPKKGDALVLKLLLGKTATYYVQDVMNNVKNGEPSTTVYLVLVTERSPGEKHSSRWQILSETDILAKAARAV